MTIEALDVLTTMGEEHTLRTAKLMHMAVGAVLNKLGETNIEITTDDLSRFGTDYRLEVEPTADGLGNLYRVVQILDADPELPL